MHCHLKSAGLSQLTSDTLAEKPPHRSLTFNYPSMTYSEILHQVSFEDIIPYLNDTDHQQLFGYKQHYDLLRQMEPISTDSDPIKIVRLEAERGGGLWTTYEMSRPWQHYLANEIILAEGVEAPLAEIAACCLLASSYYGFVEDFIVDVPTYERMWWEAYQRDPLFDKFAEIYGSFFRPSWVREKNAYRRNLKMRISKLDEINAISHSNVTFGSVFACEMLIVM